mgnify:CR=1 FL=1
MAEGNDWPRDRRTIRQLHWTLAGGLAGIQLLFGALFLLGIAPLILPEDAPLVDIAMGGGALAIHAFGWSWGRVRIPPRSPDAAVDEYWAEPLTYGAALTLWVIWSGATIIAATGALLTGSLFPGAVAILGLALILTHGAGSLEQRLAGGNVVQTKQ